MSIAEELRAEGKKEGKKEERRELAKKFLDVLDIETIAEKTGLEVGEVKRLKEEIEH